MIKRPYKVHYQMGDTTYTAEYADSGSARAFADSIDRGEWPVATLLYTEGF